MVEATLAGDWPAIEAFSAQTGATLYHDPDPKQAARRVVDLARTGRIDVVVKGQIKTRDLLGVALNRHIGIRGRGLLSHVGIFELPGMDRLIYLSDSGVVVYPTVYQKLEIINNVAKALLYFARARMAGLVVGAKVPIIISSRADSAETRYLSLAMAVILASPTRDRARPPSPVRV